LPNFKYALFYWHSGGFIQADVLVKIKNKKDLYMSNAIVPSEIKNLIYHIRGKAVMLDRDLAKIYQVDTRTLNQAVRRHIDRFPEDFMFQLTKIEFENLISQFVTSSFHGGWRTTSLGFYRAGCRHALQCF
jgi:hypothetical protein